MKNFPHQFNNLEKLLKALNVAKDIIDSGSPLTDENFGERLTREGIHTYRDRGLSIEQYFEAERHKPKQNRGYLTAARDIRRLLELLGLVVVLDGKKQSRLTSKGKQLVNVSLGETVIPIWKNAMMQLALESNEGGVSHPYRLLIKLVNSFPGIETSKLLLALEAEDDSEDEFVRIAELVKLSVEDIIMEIGTTKSMAANAVKILPGIAEQLNDIERRANHAYPVGQLYVTEDDISTGKEPVPPSDKKVPFRQVTADEIAKDPSIKIISSVSIDIADAIKIRQKRLVEHQEIVRLLALLNDKTGIKLFEGKFDCLAIKGDKALLYEIKTILESSSDQEKQTVKGVGQLKYYKFSIAQQQKALTNIREVLVFSQKPDSEIIEFCKSENIAVIWREGGKFLIFNIDTGGVEDFIPNGFLTN